MDHPERPNKKLSLLNPSSANYAVGFGKPPEVSRFRPGQSGNPKGRPKGSKSARTLLDRALSTPITIIENGIARTIQHREALFKTLTAKALKGDIRSMALIVKLMDLYGLNRRDEEINKMVIQWLTPDDQKL